MFYGAISCTLEIGCRISATALRYITFTVPLLLFDEFNAMSPGMRKKYACRGMKINFLHLSVWLLKKETPVAPTRKASAAV